MKARFPNANVHVNHLEGVYILQPTWGSLQPFEGGVEVQLTLRCIKVKGGGLRLWTNCYHVGAVNLASAKACKQPQCHHSRQAGNNNGSRC